MEAANGGNPAPQTFGTASLGSFLTLSGVTLTFSSSPSGGSTNWTVTVAASSAVLFPGASFGGSLTNIAGSFTVTYDGGGVTSPSSYSWTQVSVSAQDISLTISSALLITATGTGNGSHGTTPGITVSYSNPSNSSTPATQTLATITSLSVSCPDLPGLTGTVGSLSITTDGFTVMNAMLTFTGSQNNTLSLANNIISVSGVTLSAPDFSVVYGLVNGDGGPSVTRTITAMLSWHPIVPGRGLYHNVGQCNRFLYLFQF